MKLSFVGRGVTLLALLIILHGCRTARVALDRDLPDAFPPHTPGQILALLNGTHEPILAFRARASVAIRNEGDGMQFSAEMNARKGDSLYVAMSPALGIEAARALVTPDSFFFYDRIKNRLMYGGIDDASAILPQPFASANLFENLLGLLDPPADTFWEVSSDTAYYYLHDRTGMRTYAVDPAFWRVVRLEKRSRSGDLLEVQQFSEFDEFGDTVLPRRLVFERPLDGQRASIYYRDLTLNPDRLNFKMPVRDSAERVPVAE